MSSAAPTPFPNGRTLAGWWRQFASIHAPVPATRNVCPAFWIAHLDVHRVDALVRVSQTVRADPLALALLQAAALAPDQTLHRLQLTVPVGATAVRRAARELAADGLVLTNASGHHAITDKGRAAGSSGAWSRSANERRAFFFLRANPPLFLPLTISGDLHPDHGEADFDVGDLLACIEKPPEWKQRFGFPIDVDRILLPDEADVTQESWARVVSHRLEKLTLVLLPKRSFRAYVVRTNSWMLEANKPALEWGDGWQQVFGEYAREPSIDEWRKVWVQWVTANGMSAADATASRLERRGHRLRVTTARAVLDKLRGARNQPLLHEPWVLAGDDCAKAAVSLEIVAA